MTNDEGAIHVARGTSYLFVQNLASTIVTVIAFAIIARFITQLDMGVLASITLIVGFFTTFSSVGLPNATTKFVAQFMGKGDRDSASGVSLQTLKITLLFSGLGTVIAFVLSDSISFWVFKSADYGIMLKVLALDIIFASLFPSLSSILVGLQKIGAIAKLSFAKLALRMILIVGFVVAGFGLLGIVVAWIFSDLVACILCSAVVWKFFGFSSSSFSLKLLMKFSFPLYLSAIGVFLYGWFDQALLLALASLESLGVYSVVLRAFGVLDGVSIALSTALFPRYSEIDGRHGVESIEKAVVTATRYVFFLILPVAFTLLVLAEPAISLFVGDIYAVGSSSLMILSFFFAITSIQLALSGLLIVLDETRIASAVTVASLVVGMILAWILLPSLGIVGSSIARGLSMAFGTGLTLWILRKKMKLSIDGEAFWKSLVASLSLVVVTGVALYFYNSKFLLPVYIIIATFTYLGVLKMLKAIRKTDTDLIRSYLGRRMGFLIRPIEVFFFGRSKL